jgi:cell division protease FtsH
MPDPSQTPAPEKGRRSRSFGSFLLVLLVLLVVLAVYGNGNPFQRIDELSQDLYEWNLHQGNVVTQTFVGTDQGTHLIEGKYRKAEAGGALREFKVRYANLADREALFRELKGIREYQHISAKDLRRCIEGWTDGSRDYTPIFVPTAGRLLSSHRPIPDPTLDRDADGSEGPGRAVQPELVPSPLEVDHDQRLFVSVIAKSRSEARAPRNVKLPDVPGALHLDVDLKAEDDLSGLLAAIEGDGLTLYRQNFDLGVEGRGGTFSKKSGMGLGELMLYVGPWFLLFIVFMIFMRQMRSQGGAGGVMSFGRSRAQLYSKESRTSITFDDVAGAKEAKDEVRELVEFLKNPSRFTRIGGRIPRGVLLVGSPGCGKTLLAKAIAGEAEVPFFSISGSDFVEMFVGVGASRVRDLFKQARENSPCIIFLDEIDAVGRRRGSGMGGGHDEREQTLNAILVEMDGFGTDEGIIVVAATNRPDVLDPALLRPGRFDREVTIDLPDLEGRRAILEVHLKRVTSGDDVDLDVLARSTPGYSGADLAAIINEAAIMAVLAKRDEVQMKDLEEGRDKVRYGRQKTSRRMEETDREITAYHEAGHAIVAAVLPETDHPHKVTIVPRGRALGSTMVVPDKESYHMQRKKMHGQLAMLFGGRVAEAVFCGDISAGAHDDIRKATDLARAMVSELGMSEKIGPISYAERQGSDFLGTELMRGKIHSEETAREIDEEVIRILNEAYERAVSLLTEHKGAVEELAQALLRYETITGGEVARLLEGGTASDLRPEDAQSSSAKSDPEPRAHLPEERTSEGEGPGELPGEPGLSPA